MLHDQMEFHGIEALIPDGQGGLRLQRLPQAICDHLPAKTVDPVSFYCCGAELRFRMIDDEITLILRAEPMAEASMLAIWYGSFQGGWEMSTKMIGCEPTRIVIKKPGNLDKLRTLTSERGLAFQPDVVRVVLPYTQLSYIGVEGRVCPPLPEDLPKRRYLAYGSSITHGSLGLVQGFNYAAHIARGMNADLLNFGFAGCALLEPEMADYIMSRTDWDFATLELGVNMIGRFTVEEFEQRVIAFLGKLQHDPRPIFVTSMFALYGDDKKARRFRAIVREQCTGRFIFTDGLELMPEQWLLSADLVHPQADAHALIAERWMQVIRAHV